MTGCSVAAHVGAMGIGGKINRPRTELRKKLFKRRRELARGRRQKRRSVQAVQAPLWGKRRRKELKRLRGAAKRAVEAAVSEAKRPQKETGTGTVTVDSSGDVEMAEVAPSDTTATSSSSWAQLSLTSVPSTSPVAQRCS